MLVRKAFRYRIYPTPEQAARLRRWEGAMRWLWNLALRQRLDGLDRTVDQQKFYTAFDQINELTALRKEVEWLAEVPRNVCAQLLVELDKAWQRCFKKLAKKPRFKRKGRDSLGLCEPHSKVWRVDGAALVFPKIGALELVQHRPLEGRPKTATITREVDQWFVSISCEVEVETPLPSTKPAIAIDRGVVNIVADSASHIEPNPKFLQQQTKRIARTLRNVSSKQKGSRNRQKASVRVARLQRKVRRQREHLLHCISNFYAKNHGAIVVERLQIANMTASAKGTVEVPGSNVRQKAGLNRSILDSGWGRLVEMLRYKVVPLGGTVVEVPAAYSSQTCAACGHVDAANRPSQADFACINCGVVEHADVNAAKVLLQRYSRRTDGSAVCGGLPVAGPVKQKLRVARRGTRSRSLGSSKASDFSPG